LTRNFSYKFESFSVELSDTFFSDKANKEINTRQQKVLKSSIYNMKPLMAEIINSSQSIEAIWMQFHSSIYYLFAKTLNISDSVNLKIFYNKKSKLIENYKNDYHKNQIYRSSLIDKNANSTSIITVLSPVYIEDGIFLGMIGVDIKIDDFFNELLFSSSLEINKIQKSELIPERFGDEFSFLVDHYGEIVALPYEFLNLLGIEIKDENAGDVNNYNILETKNHQFKEIANKIVKGENDFVKFDSNNEYYYTSYYPIKSMGWSICRIVPEKNILSSIFETQSAVYKTLRRIILNFLLITVVFWMISFTIFKLFLNRNLHTPLKTITNSFKIIANGNLNHRINLNQKDEIGNIANSFNSMTLKLNLSQKELQEHKDNLEIIVEGRTNELIESNLKLVEEINERKETEQKLKNAKIIAEEANNLKTTFLSNMTHEIRTPMNSIIGFSRMLTKTDFEDCDKEKFLELIIENGKSLLKTVNDILEASKIEAGLVAVSLKPCNISKLINEIFTSIKSNKYYQNGHIEFILKQREKEIITFSDTIRLQQVITTLIENAFKFTKSGFVELGSYIKKIDDEKKVVIYVKDSGIGIEENKMKQIFDRFRQGDDSRTRGFGGTGLGLSISKKLGKLLGGEINVESKINEGSCFSIEIPYDQNRNGASQTIEFENIWKDKSIIVADDVKSNFDFICEILRPTKAKVHWAENGKECIDILKRNKKTHLILMDIQMPVLNGIDATKYIKGIDPKIPIIAQTAFALSKDIDEIYKAGCIDYLIKPIFPRDLINKINKLF